MAKDLSPDELDLLNKGDKDIFEKVCNAYANELYAFILKAVKNTHDTEDLLSETWIAFLRRKKKFDTNYHLNNYLYITAKSRISDFRESRRKKLPLIDLPDAPEHVEDQENLTPLEKLEAKSTDAYSYEICFLAIKDMSPEQKKILDYRLQRKKAPEIALLMDMPVKTVHDHLYRINKKIKAFLKKNRNSTGLDALSIALLYLFLKKTGFFS